MNLIRSRVQCFNWHTNWSWNEEVMTIWNQLGIIGTTFEFEMELTISKSCKYRIWPLPSEEIQLPNFELGHYDFEIVHLETYTLGISPKPKWVTNNRKLKNALIFFLLFLDNYLWNKWPIGVCPVLIFILTNYKNSNFRFRKNHLENS